MLQGLSAMQVSEHDFDQHHQLLNTPDGVFDLRTGAMTEHDPTLLMRNITLVSPDYGALGDYERCMPKFLKVLRHGAQGRNHYINANRAWGAYTLTGEVRHQALGFLHGPPGVGKSIIGEVLAEIMHTYTCLLNESFFSKNGGDAKRFDMANLIGKRMAYMDETQLGMSWDETRMSKGASARKLTAELKFGRTVQFDNTAKILVVGNHKPNFVAAETGGLTSRMLLIEAQGCNYRDPKNKGIDTLAQQIIDEELPAILAWLIEECVADYNTPGLFDERMAEAREAAQEYAKEDSPIRQWGTHEMCVAEDRDIDLVEAIEKYVDFYKRISGGKAPHIKPSGFKASLKAAFPSISFGNRTRGPHPNRAYINGFGYPKADFGDTTNVVSLAQKLDKA
jgi:putative DNA primase/helicase